MDFRQALFSKKGYAIRIDCTKGIYSDSMGIAGGRRKLCVQIDYLGPQGGPAVSEENETDRRTMKQIASPWYGERNPYVRWNIQEDDKSGVWTYYSSTVFLKNDALPAKPLVLRYTIPKELAGIRAVMRVYVEDELMFTRDLTDAGQFEETIDLGGIGSEMADYLEQSHRLQNILLKEFIRVCRKYDIDYYLVCGTALAALRDGDRIEWDDDTDVALTRKGYERLMKVSPQEWGEGKDFRILTPRTISREMFMDFMTRLVYMKETSETGVFSRMEGHIDENLLHREALDIYILENGTDSLFLYRLQTGLIKGLYGLALGHRREFEGEQYRFKQDQKQVKIATKLAAAGRHLPLRSILNWYDRVSRLFASSNGKYCFESNGYINCIGWRFERKWFGKGSEGKLGEIPVRLPADCDSYLKRQYGNYMELPGGFSRRPAHWDNT